MQINKIKKDMTELLSDVFDGATIMVGGFGEAGSPIELLHGLIDNGAKDLTIIANNSGNGRVGLGALIGQRQVKKVICSFARSAKGITSPELYSLLLTASKASSSQLKHFAFPINNLEFKPATFTIAPSGARLPFNPTTPPVLEIGLFVG